MRHELKIEPQYYARVADGSKTFEIRENDRGFQFGDEVELREWDPRPISAAGGDQPRGYTDAPKLSFKIGYVHVLSTHQVIFSLLPISRPQSRSKKAKS